MGKSRVTPGVRRWAALPPPSGAMFIAPAYFGAYLAYLFWYPENELDHWGTLVLVPALLVYLVHLRAGGSLRAALGALGIGNGSWRRGLGVALGLGVPLGVFQAFGSRNADQVVDAFRTGQAFWLLPAAFVLMLLTAALTEEVFFRGFLQTRLEGLLRSRMAGLLATSLCFGLYHLPYAYLNPSWPTTGDWSAAWGAALGQGIPGGLILGTLYLYSGRNLLAPVVLHALINAFPVMGMIHLGSG